MFDFLKRLFGFGTPPQPAPAPAPQPPAEASAPAPHAVQLNVDSSTQSPDVVKEVEQVSSPVEAPKCGCGRSDTGYCVGLHKLTAEEWAVHPKNPLSAVVETPAPVEVSQPAVITGKKSRSKKTESSDNTIEMPKKTKKGTKAKEEPAQEVAWPFERPEEGPKKSAGKYKGKKSEK